VLFEKPVQAVVPGQFAVFYAGERVLGGGLIRKAERAGLGAAELSP
jgi:tRNA-uridine 2-sulfurtransferase